MSTKHAAATWVNQQLLEAFLFNGAPRHLMFRRVTVSARCPPPQRARTQLDAPLAVSHASAARYYAIASRRNGNNSFFTPVAEVRRRLEAWWRRLRLEAVIMRTLVSALVMPCSICAYSHPQADEVPKTLNEREAKINDALRSKMTSSVGVDLVQAVAQVVIKKAERAG